MTPGTPPPLPGSMTVPPLHGWENIVVVLVVLVVVAVAVGVLLSLGRAQTGRSEWQAWLDGRSAGSPEGSLGTGRAADVHRRHPAPVRQDHRGGDQRE
ncbi:MAG: hypothetical protein ACLGI3_08340 [Actinomycetes bacterium]